MSDVSPSTPAEWRALRRVMLVVVPVAILMLIVGVIVMQWWIGDDIRTIHASMDVKTLHDALPRHEAASRKLIRATLQPGAEWRPLSATEYDWLIDQLGGANVQFHDDAPRNWRTAGLKDPWQRPYQTEMRWDGNVTEFRVRSLGADGQPGTTDDVTK